MSFVQERFVDNGLGHFLTSNDFWGFDGMETLCSEPNYRVIDEFITKIKEGISFLGEIKVLSDEDRKAIKSLTTNVFKAVEWFEKYLALIKTLPRHVSWKQKAYDKLENLVILLEDMGEICALSASEDFTRMIKAEIESLTDEPTEN